MIRLGTDDYREAALDRLEDALRLREAERWVGAIYLAGRAVESMLRCLLWLETKEQTSGHDLRNLLAQIRRVGVLTHADDEQMLDGVNNLAILWHNNLRFVGARAYLRFLKRIGRDRTDVDGRRVKGDAIKANGLQFIETAEAIVSHGDRVWQRFKTRSSK